MLTSEQTPFVTSVNHAR